MSNDSFISMATQAEEHPFKQPWQAHAFAIAVKLHEQGLFTWSEWAETLSNYIKEAGPDDDVENYYHHWMAALETIVDAKKAASYEELATRKGQWDRAAKATPHGHPILLEAYPLA